MNVSHRCISEAVWGGISKVADALKLDHASLWGQRVRSHMVQVAPSTQVMNENSCIGYRSCIVLWQQMRIYN